MDLNHTKKCLRESGVDAESTWIKEGGEPWLAQVWSELR